ncbi:hypothetical protein EZV73_08700 [Acidaminobacter sp. JC074]|uniref:hypothetical protein n=1 Tax=Acidaminobacter sp. JC074 TaxID=2530199 RepID=UPI001F0DD1B5|nr:hypothetical protein [Acidaminobacter sp. JC074]MCH4887650.1 hypothetical protein [Acidaminobacter sp. JC074]
MKNEDLLERIGQIDSKFIEEAEAPSNIKRLNIYKKYFKQVAAIASMFVIVFFGISNIMTNDFDGFIIAAYAAEDENQFLSPSYIEHAVATELKPSVEVLLPKYSPMMSSVPGFPLHFGAVSDEVDIKISVDGGTILNWDSLISEHNADEVIDQNKTWYWAPYSYDIDEISEHSVITVSAFDSGKLIAKQELYIDLVDGFYRATVSEIIVY